MKLLSKIVLLFITTIEAIAGSCCGGGSGTAQIMLGPTQSVIRVSFQNQTLVADSNSYSSIVSKEYQDLETIKTTNFSTSYAFKNLWQAGISIPLISKSKNINNEWQQVEGLGDIQVNTAYEYWPEYSRHQFISQAFAVFQVTLPTAPSLFTTKRTDVLDTRGQGHRIYSLSNMLVKKLKNHTFNLNIALSYREGQNFNDSLFSEKTITTKSSLNNDLSLAHSYNLNSALSSVIQISRVYEDNVATSVFIGKNQSSLVYTSSLGLNYSLTDYDISATYKDDLLIGPSYNHTLGKAISVGIVKRTSL